MDKLKDLERKITALEWSQGELKRSIERLEGELAENRVRRFAETPTDPCLNERMKQRKRFL